MCIFWKKFIIQNPFVFFPWFIKEDPLVLWSNISQKKQNTNILIFSFRDSKHIKYHFVRDFMEDGVIKIVFVKTNDNIADVHTKNTNEETHNRHNNVYMADRNESMYSQSMGGCQ